MEKARAVIVQAVRTPIGKFRQALSSFEAPQLSALAIRECVSRAGVNASDIDEVIYANLFDFNWVNIARIASLEAEIPFEVPGFSVNRQCSSSLNAVALAASLIESGHIDIALTGGVESYSKQPFMLERPSAAFPAALRELAFRCAPDRTGDPPMIETAENVAKKYGITRAECDAFAAHSHNKAAAAWDRGFFDGETFPVEVPQRKGDPVIFRKDECVRADTTVESLAKLRTIMKDGVVTAGNASPMNDGASAVLVMSEQAARERGLEPLAVVAGFASAGVDPNIMGIGPVYSTGKLMKKYGLTMDDFDLIELNEAFAAQSLACLKELGVDWKSEKVNPNGGAIAIGHPNAASGGILTCRAVRYMQEKGLNRALISFCCGGGQGFSLMLERP